MSKNILKVFQWKILEGTSWESTEEFHVECEKELSEKFQKKGLNEFQNPRMYPENILEGILGGKAQKSLRISRKELLDN